MCAEYEIRKSRQEIYRALGSASSGDSTDLDHDRSDSSSRVKLFSDAPIVTSNGDDYQVDLMRFSLKPPSLKYSTFNARLFDFDETTNRVISISEKPTWKKPLQHTRCLIPLTGFIEPIYTGEHAGHMVEFYDQHHEVLFAAGLFERSRDPRTGEFYSGFAMIMHTPDPVVRQTGHHRTPVFLQKSAFETWVSNDLEAADAVDLLLRKRLQLSLEVKRERSMARGWQKRVASFLLKAEHEAKIEERLQSATKIISEH